MVECRIKYLLVNNIKLRGYTLMSTKLNMAKAVIKKDKQAKILQEEATLISRIEDDGKKTPIAYSIPKAQEARELTKEANVENKLMLSQLAKDSNRRKVYEEKIADNDRFLEATSECDKH